MIKFRVILVFVLLMIVFSNCSTTLDQIDINDNPYDRDYVGPAVISMSAITTDTISYPIMRNKISSTKTINNHDGVRLYRNGVLINTNTISSVNFPDISDNGASSGVTYSYQLRLYLGSGETESEVFTYTTP